MQRTQHLLDRESSGEHGTHVMFSYDHDDGVQVPVMWLPHEDWEELNRPDEITVTIEPGDVLNDG